MEWTPEQASVLRQTEGIESVVQAVARVQDAIQVRFIKDATSFPCLLLLADLSPSQIERAARVTVILLSHRFYMLCQRAVARALAEVDSLARH